MRLQNLRLWVMLVFFGCLGTVVAELPNEIKKTLDEPKPTPKLNAPKQSKFVPFAPQTKEQADIVAKWGLPPPWRNARGQIPVKDERVNGTVIAVSDEGIEIRREGKKESEKYPPHTLLATGRIVHWETDAHCYLLDDVKKGDEVMIGVGTVDEEKGAECFYIRIRKRPDGEIPPSRKPSFPKAYHLEQQAEIDWKEKGIPMPELFRDRNDPSDQPKKLRSRVIPDAIPKIKD